MNYTMVKVSSSSDKLQAVENLQKKKKEKELEFRKREEEKKKELEELEKNKDEQLKEVDKHLEEAVADIISSREEEETETQRKDAEILQSLEEFDSPETIHLEQSVANAETHEGEPNLIYEIEQSDIQTVLGELYGQVKQELDAGVPGTAVSRASELLYQLEDQDVFVSHDAVQGLREDESDSGDNYKERLSTLLDLSESRSTFYKSNR